MFKLLNACFDNDVYSAQLAKSLLHMERGTGVILQAKGYLS